MRHPEQEPDVLPGRALAGIGIGVVVTTAVGVAIVALIGQCRSHELRQEWVPPLAQEQVPGEVNAMETRPFTVEAQGLDEHRREARRLGSYGWADRGHQFVHIPIEVAIDLYLATQEGGGK